MKKAAALRKQVLKLEVEMMKRKAKLARLRAKVPLSEFGDFELVSAEGRKTRLSALFGKHRELILIHNMGASCPYCTMWADGFNGVLHHLESRAALALESPDSPASLSKFARGRKWGFRLVSSRGSKFRAEAGFETRDGDPMPGVSIFVKDSRGRIFQGSRSFFGPGDNFCSVWDLMDLLPKGANGWEPRFKYPSQASSRARSR